VNVAGAVMLPNASGDDRDPGIRTILFTDIVESTVMTQQIGDEAAMELVDLHDSIVRDALKDLGGREVKHLGDGIMASFVSAASAVKCAARVQNEIAKHVQEKSDRPIRVRVGIAAGEPVERHNDLFGVTVQLASRLCSHAEANQILVSNVVAELCQGKTIPFQEIGELSLKGFDHAVRAHAVVWANESASA
jgi:class 3 adenylate cyclase